MMNSYEIKTFSGRRSGEGESPFVSTFWSGSLSGPLAKGSVMQAWGCLLPHLFQGTLAGILYSDGPSVLSSLSTLPPTRAPVRNYFAI